MVPTETSVSFKGKNLFRAFEKYFNKIYIIILTTILLTLDWKSSSVGHIYLISYSLSLNFPSSHYLS